MGRTVGRPWTRSAGEIPSEQVLLGLAADEEAGGARADTDDRWPADEVVVGGQGVVVGAGDRDREQVARVDVGWQGDVLREDVAGFAVPADDGGRLEWCCG